jgi:uncharacterized Zn-finger protein
MVFIAIFKRSRLYLEIKVQVLPKLQNLIIFSVLFTRLALNNIMQNKRSSPLLVAAGLLTAVLLPSCSLPPGVAWREIQREGLIPFLQSGGTPPKAVSDGLYAKNAPSKNLIVPPKPTLGTLAVAQPPKPSTALQPAYAVSGLSGYVRSPYTNPPRLVDVRGMSAGSKVVCPYTQRAFVVPANAVAPAIQPTQPATPQIALTKPQPKPAAPAVAKTQPNPTPAPQPAPAPTPTPKPAPAVVKSQPAPAPAPKVAAAPKVEPKPAPKVEPKAAPKPAAKPQPVETPKVASTAPAPAPSKSQTPPPPAPKTAPAAAPKLPFGTAINGRPGFVNSPYAEKHQLVDVTGLSVGTEVKCPYTGKLFRVPPQQQAKK